MTTRLIRANDVDLCIEEFGTPGDPPLLLIAGAGSSMDWWEDGFCDALAQGGRRVVRYDFRDTGRSTSYPAGEPPYSELDFVADALGILDALEIDVAHLVGLSMGGGIGQRIALDHRERLATLTLMSTTPGGPGSPSNGDLPPPSGALATSFAEPSGRQPDWSPEGVIEQLVAGERLLEPAAIDEAAFRVLVARVVARTADLAATMTNHFVMGDGPAIRHRLGEITTPTLVVHGTLDPLFPFGHAEALAAEIPGARLVPVEGGGHQFPPPRAWPVVVPAILEHTAR